MSVFVIDDGGELYWYVAADSLAALGEHKRLMYREAGVELTTEVESVIRCIALPDDRPLTMSDYDDKPEPTTLTAKEWAAETTGFLGTTAL